MIAQRDVQRHPPDTPIFVRGRTRPIGYVRGQTFHKAITGSKHLLRSPAAIAFDRSTLVDAERAGAVAVCVRDTETATIYTAQIADIWRYAFPVRRGFGDQIAMSMNRWTVNGIAPSTMYESNQARKAAQPSLFEVE
ncbi:MAG: hypothetical protein KF893_04665 [Caldilineaceae bacterium]|nr:hypothetical protein [Caldilineaceae bacterium]